jgi:magnesium transporter
VHVLTSLDPDAVQALRARDEFFWLDLVSPTHADLLRCAELFGLHAAALEDTREWGQLPKADDYGDHALLVFYTASRTDRGTAPCEVHVYLSGSWVLTIRRGATPLDAIHERLRAEDPADEELVVYRVLDALADGWDPVIDELDRRVDEVEAEVLERPRQRHLPMIYHLKQEVGEGLRHADRQAHVLPAAIDVIQALPDLNRSAHPWLRDLLAHGESIASDLHRLAGNLGALTDLFFNANANRLNRLATLIAVGSLFFLVWTLVTGFFGQNFGYLVRHIESARAFALYELGGLVVPTVVLAAILWWRRRDWWG